ncbi:hypothetical protein SH528x_006267 [Novipirellula sp. SH528]|uniref:hypothetical protein n=1 Tax=Novipirellula sp. SH528 TaxID=3454466 RepID=UPI003FA038F1
MATILSDASRNTTRSLLGLISTPNILSLDAPVVAIGWQWLMIFAYLNPAAHKHVDSSLASTVVLFLTVWLIYMADRLMDCWRMDFSHRVSMRHRFANRWSTVLWPFWCVVLISCGLIAISNLPRELLAAGSILLGFVFVYSGAVHYCQTVQSCLPKEFIVGSLFAVGVSLPVLISRVTVSAVTSVGLLAALFVLNCLCVAKAQRPSDRQQGVGSAILMYPFLATRLPWLAGLLAAISMGLGASGWIPASIAVTTSLSGIMLILVARMMDHESWGISASQWGQLADYALLTPFIVMVVSG